LLPKTPKPHKVKLLIYKSTDIFKFNFSLPI